MIDYDRLEAKSAEIAALVIQLIRTMTPDRTEQYTVQNFLTAVNGVGGYIRSIGCNTGEEAMKRRANAALEEVCKAMFCVEMLNHMAVVDIACYENVHSAYEELAGMLTLAVNLQDYNENEENY